MKRLRMRAVHMVLLLVAGGVFARATQHELTTVKAIHALTPSEASQRLAVHLRGQVTVISTYKSSFFFKDGTGGISVERDTSLPKLHSGDRVELRGVTDASLFAPVVKSENVTQLGSGTLPRVRVYRWDELSGGQQDGTGDASQEASAWGRLGHLHPSRPVCGYASLYWTKCPTSTPGIAAAMSIDAVMGGETSTWQERRRFQASRPE